MYRSFMMDGIDFLFLWGFLFSKFFISIMMRMRLSVDVWCFIERVCVAAIIDLLPLFEAKKFLLNKLSDLKYVQEIFFSFLHHHHHHHNFSFLTAWTLSNPIKKTQDNVHPALEIHSQNLKSFKLLRSQVGSFDLLEQIWSPHHSKCERTIKFH